ncbi:unknown; predicted coding region [Mycoplasmopsis pulmonis]|uniref:Uncharacterized protein n=1 Tax=Mycoplasmopsis pulmonis (strain UAB CTIP) TaxID=272635 RepID=Q98QE8_MYCPU|nr:hypothetical protein [Mycoplasmopsis pulmonis]CAC13591.1 unknown; predicted coding region [Mycoplasmopsis pulmonis]
MRYKNMYTNDKENFYRFINLKIKKDLSFNFLVGIRAYINLIRAFLIPSISDLKIQLKISRVINYFRWINLLAYFVWIILILLFFPPIDIFGLKPDPIEHSGYFAILCLYTVALPYLYFFIHPFIIFLIKRILINIYEKSFGKFKKTKQYERNLYDEKDFIDWLNFLYDLKKIDSWYEVGIYYLEKDPSKKNEILNNINQFYVAKKIKKNKTSLWSKWVAKRQVFYIYNMSVFFKQIFINHTSYKMNKELEMIPFTVGASLGVFATITFFALHFSSKVFADQQEILYWIINLLPIINIFLYLQCYFLLQFLRYKIDYERKYTLRQIQKEKKFINFINTKK